MASTLKRDFDDNLSCPVCLENFVGEHIPKDLDCPHVCCEVCLNNMPSDIIGGLKCPQCQRITTIPDGGVAALRTNLLARSLSETLSNHKKAETVQNTNLCTTHDDQVVLFFCTTCRRPICQYCIIEEHSSHSYEPVQSLVKLQKQKIGRALNKTKLHINLCEDFDVRVTKDEGMLKVKFEKAEKCIEERIQACLDEINAEGERVKKNLSDLKTKTLEKVQKQKESNQHNLQKKKDVVEEAQSCLEKASDSEYLVVHDKLFDKLKTLIEDDRSNVKSAATETGFKLEVGKWSVNLGLNLIPELNVRGDHDVPSTSTTEPVLPKNEDEAGSSSHKPSASGDHGNQEPTSSNKRMKLDNEADVLCLSDEEKSPPQFFDLTTDDSDRDEE